MTPARGAHSAERPRLRESSSGARIRRGGRWDEFVRESFSSRRTFKENFDEYVVLITGALTGIGRAVGIAFAQAGAHVVVSGRRDKEGQELAAELEALGAEASFVHGDVRNEDDVRDLVDRTVARLGSVSKRSSPIPSRRLYSRGLSAMSSRPDPSKNQWRFIGRANSVELIPLATVSFIVRIHPLCGSTTRCIRVELSFAPLPAPPLFDVNELCHAGPVRTSSQHLDQSRGSLAAHLPRAVP
jgi:hypothetical protein